MAKFLNLLFLEDSICLPLETLRYIFSFSFKFIGKDVFVLALNI
jgi:hypothetical protein